MKIKKSIVFVIVLAVSLTFTQFQIQPVFAEFEFATTKVTVPGTEKFGWSVQRLDTGFAVGEPFADADDGGSVYIFDSSGTLTNTIANPDGAGEQFGYSLSALGNTLAVGAPGNSNNKGKVYLYEITNPVAPTQSIANPSNNNNERMGEDEMNFLDVNLLVGVSKAENSAKSQAGKIYLFSTSDGSQLNSYDKPNSININDMFGRSISVEGLLFLSGAHGVSNEKGEVHAIGSSTITTFDNPKNNSPQGDRFGWSTTISPISYVVGAPTAEAQEFTTGQFVQQGIVYLIDKVTGDIGVITSPDIGDLLLSQNIEDQFGHTVAASSDLLLVGAPYDDVEKNGIVYTDAGSVYLYVNGDFFATLHNPDPQNGDLFGYSADVIGNNLIIGAPGDSGNIGAVYFATVSTDFAATLDIFADPNPVAAGADVTFTYTVKNVGNNDFGDAFITVVDPTCSPVEGPLEVDDGILSVGEEMTFQCTKTAPANDFTEFVDDIETSISFSPDGIELLTITCSDSEFQCSSVDVGILTVDAPSLNISAVPNPASSGHDSVVTFRVTNKANIPLFIDGVAGVVDNNGNCNPTGEIQDIIEIPTLHHTDFTCTVTAGTSPINFDATATAKDDNELFVVTATAQYTLNVINPAITLDISTNPNPTYNGESTTITYTVTNTGDSVVEIDGQTGVSEQNLACTPFAQIGTISLQSGGNAIFTCTVTAGTSTLNFDATATAFDQNDNEIIASDTLTVNVIAPQITLDISANPDPVNTGSTSTITYTVTNTGDSVVEIDGQTGVSEQNLACTPFAQIGTISLQSGGNAIFTCTVTAGTSTLNFDATATAFDQNGRELTASDQHTLLAASLTLNIIPIPFQPLPGSSPTIQFSVTNNGSVIFDTISVDEVLNVDCTPVSIASGPLNPSESRLFECVVPNVTDDFDIQGIATGTYTGGVGQFVVQKTITVDVLVDLFCDRPESDFDQVLTGTSGNDNIKGSNGDDLIFGLEGKDKIDGKNGDDCIIAGDGNDKVWGGKGNDTIEGNGGNDQIYGQQGNDILFGNDGDDKIYGGQGNDIIDAGEGNDRVHANQGNDIITGGDGNDWLGAGNGDDVVNGGAGNDKIFGRQGNDILNGDTGDDTMHGGQGVDTINGGDDKDKIFGQQGHDILNGNNGDDIIHGGQGNDNIDGGNGYDKCNGAQGNNTITNCEAEDKKMKEEQEENDDDEGESEDDDEDG